MAVILVRGQEPGDVGAVAAIMGCPSVVAGTLRLPYRSVEETRERQAAPSPPGHHGLIAELDGRVVGQLGLWVEQRPRRRHCGSLGMAVHDDFQGQGVGGALLAACVDLADNWLGLHRIELEVYTDNAIAIRLYERYGFVAEGVARDFAFRAGAWVDALRMARLRDGA